MTINYEKLSNEAKEVISEELWLQTIERVMDTLYKFSDKGKSGCVEFNRYDISLNLIEWANNKYNRIKKFMEHPAYNANEPFKIVHEVDAVRELDKDAINNFIDMFVDYSLYDFPLLYKMLSIFKTTFIDDDQISKYNKLIEWADNGLAREGDYNHFNGARRVDSEICYMYYPKMDYPIKREKGILVTKELIESIKKKCNPHEGQKTSKFVRKLITTAIGTIDEREFAKYADALNPVMFKRKAVLSVDPVDYLMMSHGNSWASCYWINRNDPGSYEGCYSNGTWSYMADEPTMIMYIVDNENTENFAELPKIFRQCVFFNEENLLINSRVYPSNRTDVRAEFRGYAQQFISELYGIPNNWKVKETNYNGDIELSDGTTLYARDLIEEDDDFVGYSDPQIYEISISINKANELKRPTKMFYGGKAYCPSCGNRWHGGDESRFVCEECDGEGYTCYGCGAHLSEDEANWCEDIGEYCCDDCSFYCDFHGRREYNNGNDYNEVSCWGGTTEYWCDEAVEDYAEECYECGELWRSEDMTYCVANGEYYCPDCVDSALTRCEECDELIPRDDVMIWTDPETGEVKEVCADCYERLVREAKEDKDENEELESEAI